MISAERYATSGSPIITVRDVHEYSAAMTGADWIVVIANLDNQIVDMVVTPQLFMASRKWPGDQLVVGIVFGLVAPSVFELQGLDDQVCFWGWQSVWTIKQSPQRETAHGSGAVALALI